MTAEHTWAALRSRGITPDNMATITTLSLVGTGVTDLSPISGMTGLTWLRLDDTGVTDLSPLSGMTGLTALSPSGTAITPLYRDPRGYRLDRLGDYYQAGCRHFTPAEALAHWGAPDYPNRARGDAYCAAIRAEESRRKETTE